MKQLFTAVLLLTSLTSVDAKQFNEAETRDALVGTWTLDMTPHDPSDTNFATMIVRKIENNQFYGDFYRQGVKIDSGHINTQTDRLYGALVSSDNSGSYNTSFYLQDGVLYGSTHAIKRDFLAVWTATKKQP